MLQHLVARVITGWKLICLAHVRGHVVEVAAVALGQDHVGQPGRVRGQHLLLEPADRQHAALQRDLAGHADRVLDGAAGQQRRERRRHRDAGARAVLRDRARGHVDVELASLEARPASMPSSLGVRAHVGERDPRRLLHDVAELAGQRRARRSPFIAVGLDEQDVAAGAGHGEAGRDAGHRGALGRLLEELLPAERVAHGVEVDRDRRLGRRPTRSASRSCAAACRARARAGGRRPRACTRRRPCAAPSSAIATSSSRRPLRSRWRGHR